MHPKKKIPAKVMWYAPIIPHLKCLFKNRDHAKLLRWHKKDRKVEAAHRIAAASLPRAEHQQQWAMEGDHCKKNGGSDFWFAKLTTNCSHDHRLLVRIIYCSRIHDERLVGIIYIGLEKMMK